VTVVSICTGPARTLSAALVEVPTTFGGATQTRDLILLDREVVICATSALGSSHNATHSIP
jgi:hypothetical protein